MSKILSYQGEQICRAPKTAGIYVWYFRPVGKSPTSERQLSRTLAAMVPNPENFSCEIMSRYNIRYKGSGKLDVFFGAAEESLQARLKRAIEIAPVFISGFLQNHMVPTFSRPLYVGIAKNLYDRVYEQHFHDIVKYWQQDSAVSRFVKDNPKSTVPEVQSALRIKHSFALEARVRGLLAKDLEVHVYCSPEMNLDDRNDEERRKRGVLEDVLQILIDPICGRM